jgi:hypothetical protein
MPPLSATAVEPYLAQLSELRFVASARLAKSGDAVELALVDRSRLRLRLELKASHLGADAHRYVRARFGEHPAEWLVVAPYIGAPVGESLVELGVNFIDRQGNCHIRVGERFIARIQGRTGSKASARTKGMRAAGYRVLFALLVQPDLIDASQREIGKQAGTSRQPVADLLERLEEERVLAKRRGRYAWVDAPGSALLERWVAGYRAVVRPKLFVGRFRLPVREPDAVEQWLEERIEDVRFGGTAGAHRFEPYYRGGLTVAHLGSFSEETRRHLQATKAPDGELVWMGHLGPCSLNSEVEHTVTPLLIYSELVVDPDPRAVEAADLIRRGRLSWSL